MIKKNIEKIDDCVSIVLIGDKNYALSLSVALTSIAENISKKAVVYILHSDLDENECQKITFCVNDYDVIVKWLKISEFYIQNLSNIRAGQWFSLATYFKTVIPDVLPRELEKVIYLDSDMLVKGDLSELWDITFDGNYLLAVQNLDWRVSSPRGLYNYKELDIDPDADYFNAGLMVIDLQRWRSKSIGRKVQEYLMENQDHLRWADQDGFNAVLCQKWKKLNYIWNYEVSPNPYDANKMAKAKILHYTGPKKPWHIKYNHPAKRNYISYLKKSPYFVQYVGQYKLRNFISKKLERIKFSLVDIFIAIRVNLLKFLSRFSKLSLKKRNEIPLYLQTLGLDGEGAEIGVFEGHFSETLLRKSRLGKLYSIDPWREFSKKEYDDVNNVDNETHYKRYLKTVQKLSKFKDRSKIIRSTSEAAVKKFKDNQLDFIYIDAQHSYKACKKDIEMWWSKLRKGGILAGHDYLTGKFPQGDFGVKTAVDEFVGNLGLELNVTNEQWPTWYVKKE